MCSPCGAGLLPMVLRQCCCACAWCSCAEQPHGTCANRQWAGKALVCALRTRTPRFSLHSTLPLTETLCWSEKVTTNKQTPCPTSPCFARCGECAGGGGGGHHSVPPSLRKPPDLQLLPRLPRPRLHSNIASCACVRACIANKQQPLNR